MARSLSLVAFAFFCAAPQSQEPPVPGPATALRAVPFARVKIADPFWSPRLETNRTATLGACLGKCEETGRIRNFAIAGGREQGRHQGLLFDDSDLYKVLEGAACTLALGRDPALEARLDAIIDLIAAAQQPDGYLNTYYTLVKPEERWRNLAHGHELYCAGHLIEAAVAYHQATGKEKLLLVARRLAEHIALLFGEGKRHDPPGHEEIELALVKLGRHLSEPRWVDLAAFFVDQRGHARGRELYGEYSQDKIPVRELRQVTGHAVRAMYLLCAMADLTADRGDAGLWRAQEAVWRDLVESRLYLTGGIGSSAGNEGFTIPFDLPNDTAYCESCAAVGLALWAERLFLLTGDGAYADVLERAAYNNILAGVSRRGDAFFYRNPLASRGGHHRTPWYACACCPPNLLRYLAAMGERIYAWRGDDVYVSLYIGSEAVVPLAGGPVKVAVETGLPWEGRVRVAVDPGQPRPFALHLRAPGWLEGEPAVAVNGRPEPASRSRGFLVLARTWAPGDEAVLEFPLPASRVYADPRVKDNVGRVALQRGPLVYCLEGADHGGRVRDIYLPPAARLAVEPGPELLGGIRAIRSRGVALREWEGLLVQESRRLTAVPYCLWDNREPGEMVVWLPEGEALAEPAGREGVWVAYGGVRLGASHLHGRDRLEALRDGLEPGGPPVPRFSWWDRKGTREWVAAELAVPETISICRVWWFDDGPKGGVRVPASWRLLWGDGREWRPVKLLAGEEYAGRADGWSEARFAPVQARAFRLEAELAPGFSGGIVEWQLR